MMGYHNDKDNTLICHKCGGKGHKSTYCQEEKISEEEFKRIQSDNPDSQRLGEKTICFSCH